MNEGLEGMLQFSGQWFDGSGSSMTQVRLELSTEGQLSVYDKTTGYLLRSVQQHEVEVSDRLADSPRYLSFMGGQSVETLDNHAVDQWLKQHRPSALSGWLHRLESHMGFVALTLFIVIAVVWGTAKYGVPAASNMIAHALPAELLDRASEESLYMMDQHLLEPSQLSDSRQQELHQHFAQALNNHSGLRVAVDFRHSEAMGPNAFALPNGRIIFTDQIVELAAHNDELLAVLAHEIGHVKYRHGLRRIVQNSFYVFVLAMITGDMSGNSELVLALPVLFAELAYSRAYEVEADQYALQFLQTHNIPTHRFSDLMLRLEASHNGHAESDGEHGHGGEDEPNWQRYLSTHPATQERIKAFQ